MGWAKELLRAVSELCSKHAVFASLPSKLVPFLGHISSFMHAPPLLYHLFVVVYWYHELLECLRFTCSLYLLDILLPVVVIGDVLLLIRREVFFPSYLSLAICPIRQEMEVEGRRILLF